MNKLMPILAALLTLLAACSRGFRDDLQRADALMETAPDSAMALLQAVDTATLAGRDLPYYALLYTQAQVKTDAAPASDSLIAIALESFRHDPAPDLRLRAHFYSAQVAYYSGNLPDAMRGAIVAYEIAKAQNDDYWHAKAAELMSYIFTDIYNDSQSQQFNREAIDYYLRAGKIRNHRFALCDLAIYHINQGQYNQAITILDSIRAVNAAEPDFDSALDDYASRALISALTNSGRFAEADSLIGNCANLYSHEDSLSTNIFQSYIATNETDAHKLSSALMSAYGLADNDKERLRVLYADYCNAMMWENYPKAACLADTLLWLQGEVAESLLNESVTSIQRDYYSGQATLQRQKARNLITFIIIAAVVAIVIIVLMFILYKQRIRAKNAELSGILAELARYRDQSDDNAKNMELLFKEKTETFNKLCSEYYNFKDNPEAHKKIKELLDKELAKLRTQKRLKEIEESIDKYRGGAMSSLRRECPFPSKEELRFLTFSLAGFSAKTIAFLTNLTDENFHKRKSRICARIAESDAPGKENILQKLNCYSSEVGIGATHQNDR